MKALFEKYVSDGKLSEAILVGQNMFNKNGEDKECFELYYNLLIDIAKETEDYVVGEKYLQQAIASLTYFSENVKIDDSIVCFIKEKEIELDEVYKILCDREEEHKKEILGLKIKDNDDALSLIKKLANRLPSVENEKDFNKMIEEIGKIDAIIEKDYLVERQQTEYDTLTKLCSNVVSTKLKEFETKSNREYNLRAIENYERVFKYFKDNTLSSEHKEIIKGLFAFDASRLYNETLIYYNHVYNYVLSKLDDDGKFKLTKYSILSEKMR